MIRIFQKFRPQPKSESWEDYFHGNETLIWEGHPAEGIKGTFGMVFMSLFGLPFLFGGLATFFGAFGFAFMGGVSGIGGGLFMLVFSLPFLCVGFGLVFGSWILAYYSSHFVRYALTNKRAYIAKSWWNHTMESYPILPNSHIELEEGRFDTVYFFTERSRDSDGDLITTKVGYEHIANGMEVYRLLREVQAKAVEKYGEVPDTK